jgi:hypothetical protein
MLAAAAGFLSRRRAALHDPNGLRYRGCASGSSSWFSMRLKTGVDGDGARGDDDSEAFAMRSEGRTSEQFLGVTQPVPSLITRSGFVIKVPALRGGGANHFTRCPTAFDALPIVPLFVSLAQRFTVRRRRSPFLNFPQSTAATLAETRGRDHHVAQHSMRQNLR